MLSIPFILFDASFIDYLSISQISCLFLQLFVYFPGFFSSQICWIFLIFFVYFSGLLFSFSDFLFFLDLYFFQICLFLGFVYFSDLFSLSALALQIFDIYLSALTSHVFGIRDGRNLFRFRYWNSNIKSKYLDTYIIPSCKNILIVIWLDLHLTYFKHLCHLLASIDLQKVTSFVGFP